MRRTVEAMAGSVRLQRDNHKGAFLLVEGRSDKKFYERFVDKKACIVNSTEGKPSSKLNAISVLAILEKSDFEGVLAIVDADFDRLSPPTLQPNSLNMFITDDHDIEAMLIKSPAFEKVVSEFCSEDKVKLFGQDVRQVILRTGTIIGLLRWVSQCDSLSLTFNGISFNKFINDKNLEISEVDFIEEVKNKSQSFSVKTEEAQQRIGEMKGSGFDPWQVCCGHDLAAVLSVGLHKAIGSNKASEVEVSRLERCLRLAYEESYWIETQLYSDILNWEIANYPFKVFPSAM